MNNLGCVDPVLSYFDLCDVQGNLPQFSSSELSDHRRATHIKGWTPPFIILLLTRRPQWYWSAFLPSHRLLAFLLFDRFLLFLIDVIFSYIITVSLNDVWRATAEWHDVASFTIAHRSVTLAKSKQVGALNYSVLWWAPRQATRHKRMKGVWIHGVKLTISAIMAKRHILKVALWISCVTKNEYELLSSPYKGTILIRFQSWLNNCAPYRIISCSTG